MAASHLRPPSPSPPGGAAAVTSARRSQGTGEGALGRPGRRPLTPALPAPKPGREAAQGLAAGPEGRGRPGCAHLRGGRREPDRSWRAEGAWGDRAAVRAGKAAGTVRPGCVCGEAVAVRREPAGARGRGGAGSGRHRPGPGPRPPSASAASAPAGPGGRSRGARSQKPLGWGWMPGMAPAPVPG